LIAHSREDEIRNLAFSGLREFVFDHMISGKVKGCMVHKFWGESWRKGKVAKFMKNGGNAR
jgi:hypothetical protein